MALAGVQGGNGLRLGFIRPSLEAAGVVIALVGAWGGIVPFVGPIFGFSADGAGSWQWNLAHALLSLVPGAAAFVAGLVVLAAAARGGVRQRVVALAGPLAVIAGAWFVIGPVAWPVLDNVAFLRSATAMTELAYWIGYFLGVGALLCILGAFVAGELRRDRGEVALPVPTE